MDSAGNRKTEAVMNVLKVHHWLFSLDALLGPQSLHIEASCTSEEKNVCRVISNVNDSNLRNVHPETCSFRKSKDLNPLEDDPLNAVKLFIHGSNFRWIPIRLDRVVTVLECDETILRCRMKKS